MTHPEELLADYVEGTLAEGERALVDAHLSTCAVCREELDLARNAFAALASLEERPVPLGVTGPVLAEGGRRFEHRRTAVWQRLQWGAGIAAAAALVLVVALNLGGTGGEPALRANGDGASASAPDRTAALEQLDVIEKHDANYTDEDVRALADQAARVARDGDALSPPGTDAGGSEMVSETAAGAAVDIEFVPAAPGVECLRSAEVPLEDARDSLVTIIEARFARTPAYFAVLLESPGAGQPADTVVVWVVARRDCRILTFAQQPL